jgi:hypothetical protein
MEGPDVKTTSQGGRRAIMGDEPTAETPGIKKYVRATIAEADPEGKIRLHEGIVTRDFGKEIEVVDPQLTWVGWNNPPKPKYVTKRCHKEGATVIPIPSEKEKFIEEIRGLLDTQASERDKEKAGLTP